jgi:hypothetical protein
LFLLIVANSCTYVYYPNYSVIAEVKESSLGGQVTLGFSKAQISGWYAIDSNIFFTGTVSGALSWLEENSLDTNNHNRPYKTFFAGAGMGYNAKFGEKGQMQLLGGGGFSQGHLFTILFNPTDINVFDALDIDLQSARFYLQPSVGYGGKNGGFYFIPRLTYENFFKVEPSKPVGFSQPMVKKTYLFLDPFIMGRIKTNVINIDIYGGLSFILNSTKPTAGDEIIVTQPFTFGIGLSKTFD